MQLAPLDGISLEKVNAGEKSKIDDNYAVLLAKCSNTKKTFLVKYAKRLPNIRSLESLGIKGTDDYKLVGAYPINEEVYNGLSNGVSNRNINTMSLRGVPTCPCCGNQYGVVICECGNIMCSDGKTQLCPWCGTEGTLGIIEGGMDITRGRG